MLPPQSRNEMKIDGLSMKILSSNVNRLPATRSIDTHFNSKMLENQANLDPKRSRHSRSVTPAKFILPQAA